MKFQKNVTTIEQKTLFSVAGLLAIGLLVMLFINPVYSLVGLIMSLVLFGVAYKPEIGVYAMGLLFAFTDLQIYLPYGLNFPYVDLVGMITLFAIGIRYLYKMTFDNFRLEKKHIPAMIFAVLFVCASMLSVYNSFYTLYSVKYVLRPLLFMYLVYVLVLVNGLTTKKQIKTMLWVMWSVGVFASIMGLFSLFMLDHTSIPRVTPFYILGYAPFGLNHNLIGETLVALIPLSILLVYWTRNEMMQKMLVLSTMVFTAIALLTFSRAAWLALLVQAGLFILLLFYKHLRNVLRVVLVVGIIVLPLVFVMVNFLGSYTVSSSTESRMDLLSITKSEFLNHPIIGSGPGTFIFLVGADRWFEMRHGAPLESHGIVQKLIVEVGLLGTALFGLFFYKLYSIVKDVYVKLKEQSIEKTALALMMISVAGNIVYQLFNTSYFNAKFWLPVGLIIAMATVIKNTKTYEHIK